MTIKSWHWRIRAGERSADWRVLRPNLSVNVRAVNGLISCPGETPPHLALTLLKTHSSGLINSKHRFSNFYWDEAALIYWRCLKAHELEQVITPLHGAGAAPGGVSISRYPCYHCDRSPHLPAPGQAKQLFARHQHKWPSTGDCYNKYYTALHSGATPLLSMVS